MSRISLLRHGATVAGDRYCGSTDTPLSDAGWQQLWQAVSGRHWDRVLSSPLQRCAAFASVLAQQRAIPYASDVRWRELHFGDWEGFSAAELWERVPRELENFWRDPVACPPRNAEPLGELRARVLDAWHALVDDGCEDEVLVVTHGGPIRVVLGAQTDVPLPRLLEIEVQHARIFDWAGACVLS